MRPLVGADRLALIEDVVADFDAVAAGGGPRAVSLEASLGLGKTRIAQELFVRLATTRQSGGAYWPLRLDWHESGTEDVLQARKQVEPTPGWVIPGGTDIPWLWWGITCQLTHAGNPMRAMKDAGDQLRAHLDPMLERVQRGERSRDDAIEVLSGIFDLVGVVNPGAALDAGSRFLGVFRRRRERKRIESAAVMDRRLDLQGESYAEAARIADGLTAVARSGTPVVIVIDDAQWADPALVSLLRHLIRLDDAPVLIVTTAWPEQLASGSGRSESFADWLEWVGADHPGRLRRLSLGRLADDDLAEIVRGFAPRTDASTVDRIAHIASGNPLVLNLMLDLDVIRRDVATDGRIDTDPATLQRLPSNLRAIYQDLWRQLPDAERRALTLVAVQGPEFLPGWVDEAAIRLGMYDEIVPAFGRARDVYGWIRAVNDDRYEFAERQRFDVVDDVLREVYPEESLATVRAAILDYILELKRSDRWPDLDLRTRRLALESHLDLNEQLGEGVERDPVALVDSMEQLAGLEVDAGDAARAAQLLEGARAIREAAGLAVTTEQIELTAELTLALDEGSALSAIVEAPEAAGSDEWGRRPYVSWEPYPVPPLTDLPPSTLGGLIVEVVVVEGPVYAGRVYRALVGASGATRQGRLIRAALDSGVRSAVRRGSLIASVPDAGGASDRRILKVPTQSDGPLRQMGDRPLEDIPPGELGALGGAVAAAEPGLSRDEIKRRILPLVGWANLSPWVDDLLERALPASLGVSASADRATTLEPALDEWGRLPWFGWQPVEVPDLTSLAPREVADHVVEVVAAEGPVIVGRVLDQLSRASGAARLTKSIRDAVESGIASGVRRRDLVLVSGRRGEPDSRVLRLPTQPEVVLRTPGERDTWSIPGAEIAALAAVIRERDPALNRTALKRRVAEALGWSRYTAPLDKLLEAVVPAEIAR